MITKERLEELIKEGATIYWAKEYYVNTIILNSLNKIEEECFLSIKVGDGIHNPIYSGFAYLDELYETKKQAEWALKYYASRTEELDLPTWEEFKNSKLKWIGFWGKQHDNYWLYLKNRKIKLSRLLDDDYEVEEHKWDATEENYEKACDLCLKLFEGKE